jgi:hypothetical protein
LPHSRNVAGGALFRPGLETLSGLLQIREQVFIGKPFTKLWNHRLQYFPDAKKLAAGFKEKTFVQQPVVKQRAGLLPVADHHAHKSSVLGSRRRKLHRFLECFCLVVLLEPIAGLTKPGLASQVVDLQV